MNLRRLNQIMKYIDLEIQPLIEKEEESPKQS